MASLEGKVIVVTGAASGIGLATAHLLASRGASVSLADIQQERLEEVAANIKKSNTNSRVYHKIVNVSKSDEVAAWLDESIKELGPLNGAANMAGVIGRSGFEPILIRDTEDEAWDFVLNTNLKGVFNCLRAELQRMGEGASIVNASSIAGLQGYQCNVAYCTSKHGVIGITRVAAREEGSRNIRVNCIAPGFIDTPMAQSLGDLTREDLGVKWCMKRMGSPEEVAKLIAFLLSDESSYVTGSCYTIDAGITA